MTHFIDPLMSKIGFYTQSLQGSFLSEGIFRKAKAPPPAALGSFAVCSCCALGPHPKEHTWQLLHSANVQSAARAVAPGACLSHDCAWNRSQTEAVTSFQRTEKFIGTVFSLWNSNWGDYTPGLQRCFKLRTGKARWPRWWQTSISVSCVPAMGKSKV